MLKIQDAKKTNEYFSVYYVPEDSSDRGFILMTLDGKIVDYKLSSVESESSKEYFAMARMEMRRCLRENIVPHGDNWLVMWY